MNKQLIEDILISKVMKSLLGVDKIIKFKPGLTLTEFDVVMDDEYQIYRVKKYISRSTIINNEDYEIIRLETKWKWLDTISLGNNPDFPSKVTVPSHWNEIYLILKTYNPYRSTNITDDDFYGTYKLSKEELKLIGINNKLLVFTNIEASGIYIDHNYPALASKLYIKFINNNEFQVYAKGREAQITIYWR